MNCFYCSSRSLLLPALILFAASVVFAQAPQPRMQTWRFDRVDAIGGYPTEVLGHPRVIQSEYGPAVEFDGVGDGLFVANHPFAGAETFTWEVIFRPDPGGAEAQRFFHLQEQDPSTGADTDNRMLFETRLIGDQWCVDSFVSSDKSTARLLNCKILHPLGHWYRVTAVYDGHTLRNYVGSQLLGEAPLQFKPPLGGHSSIGVRINKVYWFKGAVLMARMTPRALKPEEFLEMPKQTGPASSK